MSATAPGDAGPPTGTEPPYDGPRVSRDQVKDLGRIRRSATDRKIAGVAGGVARHLDVDPVVVRIAFVVLALFGGGGILLYLACWLFVPDERSHQAVVNVDSRTRTVILAIVGVIATLSVVGDSLGGSGFPWPMVVIGVGIVLVLSLKNRHRHDDTATAPAPPGEPADPSAQAAPDEPGEPDEPQGPWYADYRPPPPEDPRRRGPVLFWFTMTLALVAAGTLLSVDLAGADVPLGAYPATVVAACGVMLVVGAFYGRGGGLIPVGLLAAVATLVLSATTAVPNGVFMGQQHLTPQQVSDLDPSHAVTMGELKIDLTELDTGDVDEFDLELRVLMGHLEVIVPEEGITVEVEADARAGEVKAFGDKSSSGSFTKRHAGGVDAPVLAIDADVTAGNVEIYVEGRR